MSAKISQNSVLTKRYAKALFEQGLEVNKLDQIESELKQLQIYFQQNKALQEIAASPIIPCNLKKDVMSEISQKSKFSIEVEGFLSVVNENNRLAYLNDMIECFYGFLAIHRGQLSAEVSAAIELRKNQLDEIKLVLDKKFDADIQIQQKIDASLIGGLVVRIGSYMFDNSIKSKLNNLAITIKEGA